MLCVPVARLLVLHAAVGAFTEPLLKLKASQPAMVDPSDMNATVPLGDKPFTVAVNVNIAPALTGLAELARVVVLPTPALVKLTLSMKVVLSEASVPEKLRVWAPVAATEKEMLISPKLVLAGDTRPICEPSRLTLTG